VHHDKTFGKLSECGHRGSPATDQSSRTTLHLDFPRENKLVVVECRTKFSGPFENLRGAI